MSLNFRRTGAATLLFVLSFTAAARADEGWSGEVAVAGGATTGNTKTAEASLGFKLGYEKGPWKHAAELSYDFARQSGDETRNRLASNYQLNRTLTDRVFAFFRGSYERDEFSGFDSRSYLALGVGLEVIDNKVTTWTVQAAPGVKFDDVSAAPAMNGAPAVQGGVQRSVTGVLGSKFSHAFNEAVRVSNDTSLVFARVSNQATNTLALTAKLTERLSARASFEVRYDSDPPSDAVSTDTTTRLGVAYSF